MLVKALMVFSAWLSVKKPMPALISTTDRITAASASPPVNTDTTAEAPSNNTGRLLN
jgi:hypothetical protein